MNEETKKAMPGSPVPLKEQPPADSNEVFGNTRNFPFLWRKVNKQQPPREADPRFPMNHRTPEGE